jgi:hypothetical protein
MSRTPDWVTSRSDSEEKRCGSQLSMAMFDITRGPSRKPACAATNRSAASVARVPTTNQRPTGKPPMLQAPAKASSSTAFIVFPSTGATRKRR